MPFLALRSYLPPDHPDKAREIGSEPTPAAFLSTMLDVVEACAEVLTPTGTLAFEFGDTYAGSGGAGGDYAEGGMRDGQHAFDGSARRTRPVKASPDAQSHRKMGDGEVAITGGRGWPMDKSMCMIPELFAASLAYGRNLLDPEHTTDPWRIRNTIAWVRPNPPVGALGDKFRPAKSLITIAAKARDRWFDLDAVRTEAQTGQRAMRQTIQAPAGDKRNAPKGEIGESMIWANNPAGAPPLDWWKISPGGYSGSHYAVWPAELLSRPIEAMCPRRVCRTCGTPSRREVDAQHNGTAKVGPASASRGVNGGDSGNPDKERFQFTTTTTTGWTSCGCPGTDGIRLDGYHTGTGWRPGIVLDPFAGSGTSLMVAHGLSRASIGIDLDVRNADLARERLGMFVEITELGGRPHVA